MKYKLKDGGKGKSKKSIKKYLHLVIDEIKWLDENLPKDLFVIGI